MPKQTKYAHERRANKRTQKQIKERIQIQAIIDEFLSFEQLQQAQQSGDIDKLFEQVSQHLDQHQYSFALLPKQQVQAPPCLPVHCRHYKVGGKVLWYVL